MTAAKMTKFERVRAALKGEPVDRPPITFWGHDFPREWSAEGIAEAMLERHFQYDWDWMKLNPRACYHYQVWGAVYRPGGNAVDKPIMVDFPIKGAADLDRVEVAPPDRGPLAEQLQAIDLIKKHIDAPMIQTLFSPLSVLHALMGSDYGALKRYMREDSARVHRALQAIADTFSAYGVECLKHGADGIFFAPLHLASRDKIDEDSYREYGRPYDLQVLSAVRGAEFNVLHLCQTNVMFDLLGDYPVQALSWDVHLAGNPGLAEALGRTDKALLGGVNRNTTLLGDRPKEVAAEVRAAVEATGGRRLLISPGCSISPQVPAANLRAARDAV